MDPIIASLVVLHMGLTAAVLYRQGRMEEQLRQMEKRHEKLEGKKNEPTQNEGDPGGARGQRVNRVA